MERWSPSADRPPRSVAEILGRLQILGFCSNLVASDEESPIYSKEKRLSLFDQILEFFMQEIDRKEKTPALPALLGSGRSVDLFKLYQAVGEKGGYHSVTASRSWASVAGEIGFDSEVVPSLKLVYSKYLGGLNPLLRRVLGTKVEAAQAGMLRLQLSLSSSVCESEAEVGGSCDEVLDQEEKDCKSGVLLGLKRDQFSTPVTGNVDESQVHDGDNSGDDVLILDSDSVVGNGVFSSPKRKRESLAWMLNWVLRVAKNPGDPSVGSMSSNKAKDKDPKVGELMSQVLTARKVMFLKKILRTTEDGSLSQKRQKIYPSIYEDNSGLQTNTDEKLRCSQRIASGHMHSHSGSWSEITRIHDKNCDKDPMITGAERNHAKRNLRISSLLPDAVAGLIYRDPLQKRVPVGSSFQVDVPEWNATASIASHDSDDRKWLGTRIWPQERKGKRILIEQDPVGKGRQDTCACELQGSVECVRFHVVERRLRLKLQLGSAFYDWGFDSMGEEAALSWTEEEERRFKAIVRLNRQSLDKNFWDHLYLAFPSKGVRNLVSYCFNVFLLRRRSYQNRVTPDSVDTDDEERDFGFLSRPLGHDTVRARDPKFIFCAKNAEC